MRDELVISAADIKNFRKANNLSQQELASILNVGITTVSRWKQLGQAFRNGRSYPRKPAQQQSHWKVVRVRNGRDSGRRFAGKRLRPLHLA